MDTRPGPDQGAGDPRPDPAAPAAGLWAALPAWLPISLLAVAAAIHPARPIVLGAVVAVAMALTVRGRSRLGRAGAGSGARMGPNPAPLLLAWVAAVPVAIGLAWGWFPVPPIPADGSACTDPLATFAAWRLGEMIVVLLAVAACIRLAGAPGSALGLRRPSRGVASVAVAGAVVVGPIAILLGPMLARPFFGDIAIATGDPRTLVPALTFAVANSITEEVAFRGALLGWSAPALGWRGALVGQALVFGLAHTGPDFVGSPLPVLAAMTAGAIVAGWLVRRTRTLAIPLAIHAAFDIPLYYGWACRIV